MNEVKAYRKKPVVIEAVKFNGWNFGAINDWMFNTKGIYPSCFKKNMTIKTLEGNMTASVGDYIIKGVKGEFYPCKPDIFEQTYEPII